LLTSPVESQEGALKYFTDASSQMGFVTFYNNSYTSFDVTYPLKMIKLC